MDFQPRMTRIFTNGGEGEMGREVIGYWLSGKSGRGEDGEMGRWGVNREQETALAGLALKLFVSICGIRG